MEEIEVKAELVNCDDNIFMNIADQIDIEIEEDDILYEEHKKVEKMKQMIENKEEISMEDMRDLLLSLHSKIDHIIEGYPDDE